MCQDGLSDLGILSIERDTRHILRLIGIEF